MLTNENDAVDSVDAGDGLELSMPLLDSLRRVGRHEVAVRVDEAVGDLFVVGVLDAVVVMRNVVAEVLLAGGLMECSG